MSDSTHQTVVPLLCNASDDQPSSPRNSEVMCVDGSFVFLNESQLQVGNIIRASCKTTLPISADYIVLGTSGSEQELYVQTILEDGEAQLQMKKSIWKQLNEICWETTSLNLMRSCPLKLSEFKGVCLQTGHQVTVDHLVLGGSKIVLTETAYVMIVFIGTSSRYGVLGEKEGVERLAKETKDNKLKLNEQNQMSSKCREIEEEKRLNPCDLQKVSGIEWNEFWTNVPDDGNCLLHAFWLGMTTLIKQYPDLRIENDVEASSPEEFRIEFFKKLGLDHHYRESIQSTLQLFIEGIDEAFLLTMEDFYTIPEDLRTRILDIKTRRYSPFELEALPVDYGSLVDEYIQRLASVQHESSKTFYLPLGEVELMALARIYRSSIQTMSSIGIVKGYKLLSIAEIDPRTVSNRHVHTIGGFPEYPLSLKRIVRLLNVQCNHYLVHLPAQEIKASDCLDFKYWKVECFRHLP